MSSRIVSLMMLFAVSLILSGCSGEGGNENGGGAGGNASEGSGEGEGVLEGAGEGEGVSEGEGEGEGAGEGSGEETSMLPGDVPLEMVWIADGTFMMGRYSDEEASYSSEDLQHQVTISSGFWLGKHEVTQAQWEAVMGNNPAGFPGANRPVERVSWNDVQAFITALNTHTGESFRLPTEAEWEYACRAGTGTRFYWGDDLSYTEIGNYAWYWDNCDFQTHEVGGKLPNAWGVYDMSGNAWEWCEDDWHPDYTGAPSDGRAWVDSPRGSSCVIRGGGWNYFASRCRSANRDSDAPENSNVLIGFRLAR